jgi:hypothetical protein
MTQKRNGPDAVATANRAKGIAVLNESIAILAQTAATGNPPVITRLARGPGGKADYWLVSIAGVCIDTPIRAKKLRAYKRFCNAIRYRFGVAFDPMPQAEWDAIVEKAKGGAS